MLVKYPKLDFNVENFFALGSPIATFLTVRGIDRLGVDYRLPTCKNFFNIFHPYDPIAYRIEPLICPQINVKPVLMPHHLGRKRLHLEIREGFAKVSGDFKQKMYDTFRSTWSSLTDFTKSHKITMPTPTTAAVVEEESADGANKDSSMNQLHKNASSSSIVETSVEEFNKICNDILIKQNESQFDLDLIAAEATISENAVTAQNEMDIKIGSLNSGRRVDYVLQERPIESFNEYLFALASHACYWESEDTLLLIVKEMYASMSIKPDTPQQLTGYAAIEQQSISIAQAAASTLSSTFSYFTSSLPQITNPFTMSPSTTSTTSTQKTLTQSPKQDI